MIYNYDNRQKVYRNFKHWDRERFRTDKKKSWPNRVVKFSRDLAGLNSKRPLLHMQAVILLSATKYV